MATGLQLKVFLAGRVAVETDGVVIDDARFLGRQGRLLFAYLVAEQGRPVPRDELAEALWGEAPPATWDKALTVIVSKLRTLLADSGIDGAHTLTGAFGCYRLDLPEGTWVDVVVAANAAREAEEALAAGDLKQAKAAAARAESLVRQPFLPGEDGTWVEEKRREVADVRDSALNALADVCLRSGEPQEAVKWAEQTVALAPFRETGYRRLMEAHAAAGNRAEALRVYERCRRLLAAEHGAYPSPEIESIYRGLLEAPPAHAGAAAAPDAPSPDEDSLANRQREATAGHAAASPPTRRRLRLGVAIAAVLWWSARADPRQRRRRRRRNDPSSTRLGTARLATGSDRLRRRIDLGLVSRRSLRRTDLAVIPAGRRVDPARQACARPRGYQSEPLGRRLEPYRYRPHA